MISSNREVSSFQIRAQKRYGTCSCQKLPVRHAQFSHFIIESRRSVAKRALAFFFSFLKNYKPCLLVRNISTMNIRTFFLGRASKGGQISDFLMTKPSHSPLHPRGRMF